jgi:pimeloyl-ACP methyl ester carboxylesterase
METREHSSKDRRARCAALAVAIAAALAGTLLGSQPAAPGRPAAPAPDAGSGGAATPDGRMRQSSDGIRTWRIDYRSHAGVRRDAYVVLPAWYGPDNNPSLPVVISPHGRGATGRSNARFFAGLPAYGGFAVISPDGMGERLKNFSYGAPGQIDDLARMPDLAAAALPWLRIDRTRVYALGSSMGGQETLLLVARHPELLAGAAALDSVTDLGRRYRQLPALPCSAACVERWGRPYGAVLQSTLAREVNGAPEEQTQAYAARSGLSQARSIASSRVPLQIWWSTEDRIVSDQEHQSQALYEELRRVNGCAPVSAYVGDWPHSREMRASELLPVVLRRFGLLAEGVKPLPDSVRQHPAPSCTTEQGEL